MKHIKNYVSKIEKILADQQASNTKTSRSKGLLSSTIPEKESTQETTDIEIVAKFIEGIRTAKQGMTDAKK